MNNAALITEQSIPHKTGLAKIVMKRGSSYKNALILPGIRLINNIAHISVRNCSDKNAREFVQYILVAKEGEVFDESPVTPGERSCNDYDVYLGCFEADDGSRFHVFEIPNIGKY